MNEPNAFKWGDTAFVRPRPGAGRRGAVDAAPVAPAVASPSPGAGAGSPPVPLPATVGLGFTPLVQAAAPLLLLIGQLRQIERVTDVHALREDCLDQISRFEQRALTAGVQRRVVEAARYALCSSVDEAVLSTMWGAQSEWMQNTLLLQLHREAHGGDNFFVMLDRFSHDPVKYAELLELHYLCIALGFTGRYHGSEKSLAQLRHIRSATFQHLREQRGAAHQELSLRWRGVEDRRNPIVRYVPAWVAAVAILLIVAVTYTVLAARLRDRVAPVHDALAGLGQIQSPRPSASATLKQLLAREIARGLLSVVESGNQTTITPEVANLFESGSAQIDRRYEPTLERIAAALNQVPGRVLVTGHTDDRPIRSSRYADNFDLSRERALAVARLLQAGISQPGRVTWKGVGSSQPRATPVSLPESRDRNRRVEVIHVP